MHTVSIKSTYSIKHIAYKVGKEKWQGENKEELEERKWG